MIYKTVGIVGAGIIGKSILEYLATSPSVSVGYVFDVNAKARKPKGLLADVLTDKAETVLRHSVDLVIEAAHADFLTAYAPRILRISDLCAFSCSALANIETEKAILESARHSGNRFFLPHGAILGLDGLIDGRDCIDSVTVTTTKNGSSFGRATDTQGVIFDGPTREACKEFPRNVNVHAAIALAGIGFDRTRSIIVAKPRTTVMSHQIKVTGPDLKWVFAVRSRSVAGVTGSFTPRSAVGSIARILGNQTLTNV